MFYYNILALFDTTDLIKSTVLCVTQCPDVQISTVSELQEQAQDGHAYCKYDIPVASYTNGSGIVGDTCPYLPLFPRYVVNLNLREKL